MSAWWLLVLVVTGSLAGRPDAAGFCTAQSSLLTGQEGSFAFGRQRSCGVGDRWLSQPDTADILYHVHELAPGTNTSLSVWLQMAGLGNSSLPSVSRGTGPDQRRPPPPAGWRWDWWISNTTAAERRFQQRISAVLVQPLVRFTAELGGAVPPAKLSALLRELLTARRSAHVLAALREVNGNGSLKGLLSRDGSLVRTLSSAVTELVVLTSGASRQIRWVIAPHLNRNTTTTPPAASTPASETSRQSSAEQNTTTTSGSIKRSHVSRSGNFSSSTSSLSKVVLMSRVFKSLAASAPFSIVAGTVLTLVPLLVVVMYLLLGVPPALLMTVTLYSGVLLAGALARGLVGEGEAAEVEPSLLLGRATEAVVGGFFRMKLLRTLLMFMLQWMSG